MGNFERIVNINGSVEKNEIRRILVIISTHFLII